jgi:hypothetical protein
MAHATCTLGAPRAIERRRRCSRALATALALLAGGAPAALRSDRALASPAPPVGGAPHQASVPTPPRSLRASRDLWSTIDVCNPHDQRYTVGIRGSMPSYGSAGESMFMRFRLQYFSEGRWTDLAGALSGLLRLAGGDHQDGFSFTLKPPPRGGSFTLRGVVSFQWRRGSTLLATISRATSPARQSGSGADPAGFSAAECVIS